MSISGQDVSWEDIESLVKILSRKIKRISRQFGTITTISRGGLVPSRLLADNLGIQKILVDSKKISSNSLFVDDIYDSGNTFDKVISRVDDPSNLVYATLFAREGKKLPRQLVYAKKTDGEKYVVFPWDKMEFTKSKKQKFN